MASVLKGKVLYVGHMYYHTWYLSRALRKIGWTADTLNIDPNPASQVFYHGEDYKLDYDNRSCMGLLRSTYHRLRLMRRIMHYKLSLFDFLKLFLITVKANAVFLHHLNYYFSVIEEYDVFHFSNANGLTFSYLIWYTYQMNGGIMEDFWDVKLIKRLGKKVVYSVNGCLDGTSKTSLLSYGELSPCHICMWRDNPDICSDEKNLSWGKNRNILADRVLIGGGYRRDYNDDSKCIEGLEFYCLDSDLWNPNLLIPANNILPFSSDTVKIYHSMGNFDARSESGNKNIKCTHIYVPVIERLKEEGYNVELIFFKDVPNKQMRYYQLQADIVVDMLTFGFFGANIREAMMLGKPCVCYLRPEWLENIRREMPEYADELPVISATPDTIYDVLKDLIENTEKRREIGKLSRDFALKWHSADAGARRMEKLYSELLVN